MRRRNSRRAAGPISSRPTIPRSRCSRYLPQGLDAAKIEALIAAAIQETGAQSKKDMGKVIGALKKLPEAGQIDFGSVSKLVQAKLP